MRWKEDGSSLTIPPSLLLIRWEILHIAIVAHKDEEIRTIYTKASRILVSVSSQRVDEVRSLVAQLFNLRFGLACNPAISLAPPPFRVLPAEEQMLNDAATQQEERFVCQDDPMAGFVSRRIFLSIDIG